MTPRTLFLATLLLVPATSWCVLTVSVEVVHETCTYSSGSATAAISGGVPPYTFAWNTGETTQSISGLPAGQYSVMVTDGSGAEVTAQGEVLSMPYELMSMMNDMPWCTAPFHAFNAPEVSGLVNTWTVNGSPAILHNMGIYEFPSVPTDGSFSYPVDDGNGCAGTVSGINGTQITDWPQLAVTSVVPSCGTQPLGAINLHADGTVPQNGLFLPFIDLIDGNGVQLQRSASPDANGNAVFPDLVPGLYGFHWWLGVTAEHLDPGICAYDTVWVSVPNLGDVCGSISGRSYLDLDEDCTFDAGDVGLPYAPLMIMPGNDTLLTGSQGQYALPLYNGAYTLEQLDPTLEPICPGTQPVPFTIASDQQVVDLANSSTLPLDLAVGISGSLFRPGFTTNYHLVVRNISPQQSGPVTVTVELDPLLLPVGSSVPPATQVGSSFSWELPPFAPFGEFTAHIQVQVPVGTALGTPLTTNATIETNLPDAVATNDAAQAQDEVVGSYDPNDKRATTSTRTSDELYLIDADEWIDYTIRFQNTGTFLAEFVVITDTLPSTLDLLTFQQGAASHPFTASFKPGRVVEWRFDGIMLPDSASDEPGSHGLVNFRIRPRLPIAPATVIENVANIYFDYNEPVITEPSVLVAEFSTSIAEGLKNELSVSPVPATEFLQIRSRTPISSLLVIASDGRPVLQHGARSMICTLSVADLGSGAYVILVHHVDGTSSQARFIKH
ncbi:MAG: SprB repeat-containing protein [Flavobacteriales bacterium]|nr:SprB repeat-containing protein [Flavobacteriales bacterium]